jgi:glycine/D-amino acid oxidase-like deaminating enzyme
MNRRDLIGLTLGSLAAAQLGCERKSHEATPLPTESESPAASVPEETAPAFEGSDLAIPRIDPAREIRTITGLRPFRPSGFVVRRETREGRSLIHNYGHGGGGMTLSWGCSQLAIQLAGPVAGLHCTVIGGGVMGLSTARLLQIYGARVSIHTRDLPPNTTSNIAGAQIWPVSVFTPRLRTEEFGRQFVEATRFSFRYFQNLVGPRWGVRWIRNYYLSEAEPDSGWFAGPGGVLHDMQVDFRDFGPGEHLLPARYARRFHTMLVEPATYLETLLHDLRVAGAEIHIRDFSSASELLALPGDHLFNCSGLGAATLFDDPELIPVKGQLTVLLPQPELDYNLIRDSHYLFPRSDGLILGGTFQRNVSDLSLDSDIRRRMLAAHQAIANDMRLLRENSSGRPPSAPPAH